MAYTPHYTEGILEWEEQKGEINKRWKLMLPVLIPEEELSDKLKEVEMLRISEEDFAKLKTAYAKMVADGIEKEIRKDYFPEAKRVKADLPKHRYKNRNGWVETDRQFWDYYTDVLFGFEMSCFLLGKFRRKYGV